MAPIDFERHQKLSRIFTPNAPIARRELFRGRFDQILQITNALSQPGQHAVLYGERGVGKTSLANLITDFVVMQDDETGAVEPAVRVNCTTQDSFQSIWTKVFRELGIEIPERWRIEAPDPDELRWVLADMPAPGRILVLDEFDRVEDDEALSLMADTIKSLSDHQIETKVVVVGVADSLDQLIGEHESVQRSIDEVHVPRMSQDDVFSIIDEGLAEVDMGIDDLARTRISRLSEGLPHYAHLLTLHAGQNAVNENRETLRSTDVETAIDNAVQRHSLVREYQTAIQSPRRENLFSRVLAACALAEKNRLGYFTPGAVRAPMSKIMGRPYEIAAFAPHLNKFTEIDRGSVLRREGPRRRYTYRFRNPLLQPFSIFAALAEGVIPDDYKAELFG